MTTGADIVHAAMDSQGLPYVLGAEADLTGMVKPSALDCSELVQLACALNGIAAPDGTVSQWPWSVRCAVDDAITTPGALLFHYIGPSGGGGAGNHVAISRGDGSTIEARGRKYGVGVFPATGRGWSHGGLIPSVDYTQEEAVNADDYKGIAEAIGNLKVTTRINVSASNPTGTETDLPLATLLSYWYIEYQRANKP